MYSWKIVILTLIFNIEGFLLPGWVKNPNKVELRICTAEKNNRCVYKKMMVRDYIDSVADLIDKKASRNGFDPLLLTSIISVESSFNPNVVSSTGGMGLCQILPNGVASQEKVISKGKVILRRTSGEKLFIPEYNLDFCINNLVECRNLCGNDILKIAGCHNQGICPDKMSQYMNSISQKYKSLKNHIIISNGKVYVINN